MRSQHATPARRRHATVTPSGHCECDWPTVVWPHHGEGRDAEEEGGDHRGVGPTGGDPGRDRLVHVTYIALTRTDELMRARSSMQVMPTCVQHVCSYMFGYT